MAEEYKASADDSEVFRRLCAAWLVSRRSGPDTLGVWDMLIGLDAAGRPFAVRTSLNNKGEPVSFLIHVEGEPLHVYGGVSAPARQLRIVSDCLGVAGF